MPKHENDVTNGGHNFASILRHIQKKENEHKKNRSKKSLLDESESEKLLDKLNRLIFRAARKVKDHPEIDHAPDITHNNDLLKKARDFFIRLFKLKQKELKNNAQLSPAELANMALLGVLAVSQTGTVQIYLQAGSRHSNYYGVANQSAWQNRLNPSELMSEDIVDFTFGDSLGLETEAIENELKQGGALIPEIIEYFEEGDLIHVQRINQEEENKKESSAKSPFTTPELRPPIQFTEDDGEGD